MALKKKKADVLAENQQKLDVYTKSFECAVKLVTQTVENLTELSSEIDKTVGEIEAYQAELNATKEQLSAEKRKNDKVIQNFKALLATD